MRNDPQFKRKVLLTLEELHHTGKRYDPVPIALLTLVFGANTQTRSEGPDRRETHNLGGKDFYIEEPLQSTGEPCKSNEPLDAMDSVLAWAETMGLVESKQTHDLQNGVRLTAKGMEYLEQLRRHVESSESIKAQPCELKSTAEKVVPKNKETFPVFVQRVFPEAWESNSNDYDEHTLCESLRSRFNGRTFSKKGEAQAYLMQELPCADGKARELLKAIKNHYEEKGYPLPWKKSNQGRPGI